MHSGLELAFFARGADMDVLKKKIIIIMCIHGMRIYHHLFQLNAPLQRAVTHILTEYYNYKAHTSRLKVSYVSCSPILSTQFFPMRFRTFFSIAVGDFLDLL